MPEMPQRIQKYSVFNLIHIPEALLIKLSVVRQCLHTEPVPLWRQIQSHGPAIGFMGLAHHQTIHLHRFNDPRCVALVAQHQATERTQRHTGLIPEVLQSVEACGGKAELT